MTSPVFNFGTNWERFVSRYLNQERISEAERSLQSFAGLPSLQGRSFLDIGCGSGLFSLAACNLDAQRVVSLDVDPASVRCTERLRDQSKHRERWTVEQASILDTSLPGRLGTFDLVYSWGVLHHTGNLWFALGQAMQCVTPGGLLYIAIYNRADSWGFHPDGRFGPSSFWLKEKKLYVRLPCFFQRCIDIFAMGSMCLLYLMTLRNPVRMIRNHKSLRGMSWTIDITDWLGGYPYECATVTEVFSFAQQQGFILENVKCNNGLLNNEYLFRRRRE